MQLEPLAPSSRAFLRALNLLPAAWAEECLALAALAQGMLRPSRRRPAHRWAASQPGVRHPWRLTRVLLAERGRFLAALTQVGVRNPKPCAGIRPGREAAPRGGRPARRRAARRSPPRLRRHGTGAPGCRVPRRLQRARTRPDVAPRAGALDRATGGGEPHPVDRPAKPRGRATTHPADPRRGRRGLHGGRRGRPRRLHARAAWTRPRAQERVADGPARSQRDRAAAARPHGGRSATRPIHPPFPEPAADLDVELAACRAHLAPIVEEFVRQWPEQCFMLALGRAGGPVIDARPTIAPARR